MKKYLKNLISIISLLTIFVNPLISSAAINIVSNGGTGVNTITGILQGNGTSPFSAITVGTGLNFSGGTLSATGGGGTWGSITGTLSSQTDLQSALNAKQNTITTGTTGQYFRGDLSLATFPTQLSSFTNDLGNYGGFLTSINSLMITNALGFTPYNSTNPSSYISNISGQDLSTASNATSKFITLGSLSAGTGISYNNNTGAIANSGITTNTGNWAGTWQTYSPSYFQTALGYTPYNATNPSGFISNLGSFTTSNLPEGSNLYFTNARAVSALAGLYQTPISLTTTGTSGPATLSSGVLNIPQYSGGGGTWGSITGTLSSQTDLNTALGLKMDKQAAAATGDFVQFDGSGNSHDYGWSPSSFLTPSVAASTYQPIGTYLTSNAGDWAGTWQTYSPSHFQTALGFTPYNATNPSGYISNISGQDLSTASNTTSKFITLTGLSSSATGLTYTNTTGVFSLTSGYTIPTNTQITNWGSAYSNMITSLTTTGTSGAATLTGGVLNIPQYSGGSGMVYPGAGIAISTGSAWGTSLTDNSTNWNTAYTNRITSLTTTGSSGSATLSSNTLNIPTYTLSGLGGQASSTNLTSLSGLTYTSTSFVKMTGANTFALDTNTYLTSSTGILSSLGTTKGDLITFSGASTPTRLGIGSTNNYLTVASGLPAWSTYTLGLGGNVVTAGAFTLSGAYGFTGTLTNTTAVTFPTSGTLVSSVTTANGVSATNTAGALSFTLGAITPTTINGATISLGYGSIATNLTVGASSLTSSSLSGGYNVGLGKSTLTNDTTGQANLAIGYGSLATLTTGVANTGIGSYTLVLDSTGGYNVAIGSEAGYNWLGSNALFVNNVQESSSANDQAYSLLYGTFSGTAGSLTGQQLTVNGAFGINSTSSTVSCGTSGTVKFSEPEQGSSYKKVVAYASACLGAASYTFPTAFTNTPAIDTTNELASSVATSLTTTAITITGATSTGYLFVEGN